MHPKFPIPCDQGKQIFLFNIAIHQEDGLLMKSILIHREGNPDSSITALLSGASNKNVR